MATGGRGVSLLTGLSSDEFALYNGVNNQTLISYYRNELNVTDQSTSNSYWSELFNFIFLCNSALEGVQGSVSLSPTVKNQLIGEALFLRAFCHFYLVNLYGDVPYVTTTDYKINSSIGRIPKSQVYKMIAGDLVEAQDLLSDEFLDSRLKAYLGTSERVRPTKWAATALLSRVYLYDGKYLLAEEMATEIISQSQKFELVIENETFLMNSKRSNLAAPACCEWT